jgi:hypothetical protein
MYLQECPFSFSCGVMLRLEILPPRRSDWGSSLPPDCFVSRGSISLFEYFLTWFFWRGDVVSASPNPQAGGPPLVVCPRLRLQYIRSYPPYRRPFLHPQPEDALCRGDRDPLIHGSFLPIGNKLQYTTYDNTNGWQQLAITDCRLTLVFSSISRTNTA